MHLKGQIFNYKVAALIACLAPGIAQATCALATDANTGSVTFTLPAMTTSINPSDSGSVEIARTSVSSGDLASAMNMSTSTLIWSDCLSDTLVWTPLRDTIAGSSPASVATGYIETGIDNLYMYMYGGTSGFTGFRTPLTTGAEYVRSSTTIGNASVQSLTWGTGLGDIYLVLYQTGPIRKGGTIPAGSLAELKLGSGLQIMNMYLNEYTVNVLGCSITTPLVSVEMDRNTFVTSFTGVGSTAGDTSFAIEADCDSGLLPTLTFEGTTDSSDESIFAFTNQGDDGAASGLGVQIKYNGTAITNNVAVNLAQTKVEGATSFPFTANYIQTGSSVGAGNVSTSLTYTLSYQ